MLFENVAALIATRKDEKDEELQTRQGQNQSNLQNRRKLIQYLRDYVKYSRSFAEQKVKLTEMNRSFITKEVKATGHTLYIENTFKFNEEVFDGGAEQVSEPPLQEYGRCGAEEYVPDKIQTASEGELI
mgnify:CR=1 FL=1